MGSGSGKEAFGWLSSEGEDVILIVYSLSAPILQHISKFSPISTSLIVDPEAVICRPLLSHLHNCSSLYMIYFFSASTCALPVCSLHTSQLEYGRAVFLWLSIMLRIKFQRPYYNI